MIKAVIFDLEGTLFHIRPSVGAVYAQILRLFGKEVPVEEIERRFQTLWPEIKRKLTRFGSQECLEFWREAFSLTVSPWLDGLPFQEVFREAYEIFTRPEVFTPAPGIPEALVYLRERGLRTAILSNWDERIYRLLAAARLEDLFEAVLVACELGVGKPQPEAFHLACESLAVRPSEALMIGNDLEDDYRGAKQAGLAAYLYQGEDFRELIPRVLEEVNRASG